MAEALPAHDSVADRLDAVRVRVRRAAERAGRPPEAVTVVAVSKTVDARAIAAAAAAGHRDFGESRVQELEAKAPQLPGVRWHFVGRLQRNKVKAAVSLASLIHSVDRPELAEEIARRAQQAGRVQPVLVQVNVGQDPAKAGVELDELDEMAASVRRLRGLSWQGLMTIPPMGVDPRVLYRRLREARDRLRGFYPEVQHLSMGMSADLEVAVEEGATIVRVGAALFGPRSTGR